MSLSLSWLIWKVGATMQTTQIVDGDPEKTEKGGPLQSVTHMWVCDVGQEASPCAVWTASFQSMASSFLLSSGHRIKQPLWPPRFSLDSPHLGKEVGKDLTWRSRQTAGAGTDRWVTQQWSHQKGWKHFAVWYWECWCPRLALARAPPTQGLQIPVFPRVFDDREKMISFPK